MKPNNLLICIREDNYCIEELKLIEHPKVNEIVQIENVFEDDDGVWLSLIGYDDYIYDANCFKQISLKEINALVNKEVETF